MREKEDKRVEYVAVEVAVKIRETLHGEDDETPRYEYISEAKKVVEKYSKNLNMAEGELASLIASTLSDSLEFKYEPSGFSDIAKFIKHRMRNFASHSMI